MSPKTAHTDIVLVTGANQGIGFETARKLAAEHEGYHVIMAGRRKDATEDAARILQDEGLSVEPLVMDVNSDESIAAAVETTKAKHGRLDVLINNAGISAAPGAETRAAWTKIFDTNVFSVAAVTDGFLPLLEKSQKTKRLVFVSSNVASLGLRADPTSAMHGLSQWMEYSCSKSALNMLALHYVVRFENDPTWKINLGSPGYCATNLNGYFGTNTAGSGAVHICHLATLGSDGESGAFSEKEGPIPW